MNSRKTGFKRSRLSAALLAALLVPAATSVLAQDTAGAQDPAEQQDQDQDQATTDQSTTATDAQTLNKVIVTGSRISRTEIEGPAPVTIITAEDLEQQGFSTVYDALNTLTQFTGSVQNELTQNGFTPNASFLNLRGLGPGYQLVLINGRRAADYPLPYNSQSNAVNLNAIPAAAIERVEILSGGASSIYGSDAVAGVVNIIMRTNYEGDLVTARVGTTTRGGGDTERVQWVGGKVGDKWSLTYAFEWLKRDVIYASQREFMDSYRDDPSIDPSRATGVSALLLQDAISGQQYYPDGLAETCGRFPDFETFAFNSDTINRCYYYGYPATQAIRNADKNVSGYGYFTYDFNNTTQGFLQASVTQADAILASSTQWWGSGLFWDPTIQSAGMEAFLAQYGIPYSGGALVQTQRIFTPSEVGGVGAQSSRYSERAMDFVAGLRGTMFDYRFDWDATLSHGRYQLEVDQPRFLRNPLFEYFLGEQLAPTDPIFGNYPVYVLNQDHYFNPIDPATFNSLSTVVKTDAESQVTQASFSISGDLLEMPAGSLGMAAVIEGANQKYDLRNDPRIAPDYNGPEPIHNLTGTGGAGERNRYALGVEFSIPVLDTLQASLSARYDMYDDVTNVDGAVTWGAGLEWRPVDSLLLRGTHSTSFRAPDMHYVFARESGFFNNGFFDEYRCRRDGGDPTASVNEPDTCFEGTDYVYSVFATRSGSTELEEETGRSTTVGFVWDIMDNMSMSVDWYNIKLEGAVRDISTSYLVRNEADCRLGVTRDGQPVDTGSEACAFFLGLIDRLPANDVSDEKVDTYRSIPFNQSMQRTSGLDATWRYNIDTDRMGDFNLQLGWTHVLKLEQQEFPGSDIVDIRDHLQYFNFRSRVNWSVGWERNDWSAQLYGYRWGSLPNWEETGRIAPYIIWNGNVQKQFGENFRLGLYVNNIFDKLHPKDDSFNSYPFFWRAYSPVGREVFLQAEYKFN